MKKLYFLLLIPCFCFLQIPTYYSSIDFNQNGNFEFFTRAVDVANISILLNIGANTDCQHDTYYNVAEATWKNMQEEIVDWVYSYGGQANLVPSTAVRVDKEQIELVLTSNESIDQIEYNCN